MLDRLRERLSGRRFGVKTLGAVAFSCVLAGLLVATGFNMPAASSARTDEGVAQVAATQPALSQNPGTIDSFAPLAERLSPTVVNIKVIKVEKTGMTGMPGMRGGNQDPFGDFFEHFFNQPGMTPRDQKVVGAGSGVIINSNGTILTNNHVVEGAKDVKVTLADQKEFSAKVLGRDPKTDLAVLKVDAKEALPAAALGDSDALRVGDWVIAIGNPFGLSHTVTSGIVSAKGRVIGEGPYDNFIQTDASINPGNSGGPLFNMAGQVVGINTAIIPNGQGIGFAVPVNTAKPLIPQLITTGEVTRGYLGVNIQNVTPDLAKALNLGDHKGALVASVVEGSPAEKAGVERGDVIVSYNGKTVKDSHDLPFMVAETPVGKDATLTILRDGQEKNLNITVGKLASNDTSEESTAAPAQGKWGMQLQNITPDIADQLGVKAGSGVLVSGVRPDSPADQASIKRGDVILEVNKKPVKSVADLKNQIAKSKDKDSLLLLVQRDNATIYIALKDQG